MPENAKKISFAKCGEDSTCGTSREREAAYSGSKKEMTCVVCPTGCVLTITLNADKSVKSVTGNACGRGVIYAENECVRPMRTLTTTAALANGRMLPVRTDRAVPRDTLIDCMREINRKIVAPTAKIYDIIIENVADTGANVVAAANGSDCA
ncbi:MAG: DUF1667 domain-containing protein [Oscillospiraceae bacterium]|jgi:CxxC motif-containing protein|nr:DUF1667 domain-containing protein [Oscillospiraceae bacterium]